MKNVLMIMIASTGGFIIGTIFFHRKYQDMLYDRPFTGELHEI